MENKNQKAREEFVEQVDLWIKLVPYYKIALHYAFYCLEKYYSLEDKKEREENLLHVFFLDYYTLLVYKRNENTMSAQEKDIYLKMSHLEYSSDVEALFKNKPKLFLLAANSTYLFEKMDYLGKYNRMKNISKQEYHYLCNLFPSYSEDQLTYGGWLSPEYMVLFYQTQFARCQSNWKEYNQSIVIPYLMGTLRNLSKHDYVNYTATIQHILAHDYIWSYYLCQHMESSEAIDYVNRQYRMRAVEQYGMEMLPTEVLNNSEYFCQILESYLEIESRHASFLTEQMTTPVVEQYVEELAPLGYAKIKESL